MSDVILNIIAWAAQAFTTNGERMESSGGESVSWVQVGDSSWRLPPAVKFGTIRHSIFSTPKISESELEILYHIVRGTL